MNGLTAGAGAAVIFLAAYPTAYLLRRFALQQHWMSFVLAAGLGALGILAGFQIMTGD